MSPGETCISRHAGGVGGIDTCRRTTPTCSLRLPGCLHRLPRRLRLQVLPNFGSLIFYHGGRRQQGRAAEKEPRLPGSHLGRRRCPATPGPGRFSHRPGLRSRPPARPGPRRRLLRGHRPGSPANRPVGTSASPRPGPASSLRLPGGRWSPYPQDVVAFRAPAWDLNALRGAHGGGRSVWPGRAPRCSPPPARRPSRCSA